MDTENNNVSDGQRQNLKNKYLVKLLPIIKHRGFSHLKIDELVRYMDISKATFYKYFASKEEVVELVVEIVVGYLQQATKVISDQSLPYLQRFQNAFEQALIIANYLSDGFLLDLKQFFPVLWERIKQAQQYRQKQLQLFYEQGITAGIFQPINPILVVLQDERLLQRIIDPVFLMEHDLTLKALLSDYYELQQYQWLVPEVRKQIDDEPIKQFIDMMARKISLGVTFDGTL
jgi:AcrR family transcriptional regulator